MGRIIGKERILEGIFFSAFSHLVILFLRFALFSLQLFLAISPPAFRLPVYDNHNQYRSIYGKRFSASLAFPYYFSSSFILSFYPFLSSTLSKSNAILPYNVRCFEAFFLPLNDVIRKGRQKV